MIKSKQRSIYAFEKSFLNILNEEIRDVTEEDTVLDVEMITNHTDLDLENPSWMDTTKGMLLLRNSK